MGGGKSGSSGTTQQNSTVSIPPEVLARYNSVNSRAEQVAGNNFQSYGGEFVAPVNPTQQGGIQNITNAGYTLAPYFNAAGNNMGVAAGLAGAATGPVNAQPLDINGYMSPYNEAVVKSTLALTDQQQQQQQNALRSQQIMNGSFGGDRSGISQDVLAGQQGLARASIASGLYNQNYAQALGAAQQQQGVALGAAQANRAALQQGAGQFAGLASGYAGLGTGYLQGQLAQGQAQIGAGTLEQQTQQARDQALYNQFLQEQAYPFQTTQFLANIAEGTGALSGSSTQATSWQPQPFWSDERLKENIETIGHTKDGLKIIRFNYKGHPQTHIGFSAQDVEKKKPEAVGLAGGYKTVDYDRATRARGGLAGGGPAPVIYAFGGTVANDNAGEGYAEGGAPYYDPAVMAAILAAQQSAYPGGAGRPGLGGTGPRGMQLHEPGARSIMKAELPKLPQQEGSGLRQGLGAAKDAAAAGKGLGDLYSEGKDALVGSAAKGNNPATGGLIGSGGKFDYDKGWLGRQTSGFGAAASNASNGAITSTPLPDLSSTARDTGTAIAAAAPADDLVSDALDYAWRGGRAKRYASGGMPYDDGGGYVPEDDIEPLDPAKLSKEQKDREAALPSIPRGSSGGDNTLGDIASIAGTAAKILPFFLRDGGRAGFDEGGDVDIVPGDPMGVPAVPDEPRKGLAPQALEVPKRSPPVIVDATPPRPGLGDVRTAEREASTGVNPAEARKEVGKVAANIPTPATPGLGGTARPDVPAEVTRPPTGLAPQSATTTDGVNSNNIGNVRPWGSRSGFQQPPDFDAGVGLTIYNARKYPAAFNNGKPMTIAQIGAEWAPKGDGANDPMQWARNVSSLSGLPIDQPLDLHDPKTAAAFARGVHGAEHGSAAMRAPADYLPGVVKADDPAIAKGFPSGGGGGNTVVALNAAGPAAGLAGPAVGGGTNGLGGGQQAQNPYEGKDFLDRAGIWFDRHERQIIPALAFLGNMLASPSRTLTGSIGSGMVGAAGSLKGQQEIGQGQQRIDITKNAQYMSVLAQLRQMQSARAQQGLPPDPVLDAQVRNIANLIAQSGGVSAVTSAGMGNPPEAAASPGNLPAGGGAPSPPSSGTPPTGNAPAPVPAPPAAAAATADTPAARWPMPGLDMRSVAHRIDPDWNPQELDRRAKEAAALGDTAGAASLKQRATEAQNRMEERGELPAVGGGTVNIPGFNERNVARANIADNQKTLQAETSGAQTRQVARMQLNAIKDLLQTYESGTGADVQAEIQGVANALNIPLPDMSTMNAQKFQEFVKNAYGIVLSNAALNKDETNQLRDMVGRTFASPEMQPGANRKILAETEGMMNLADKKYSDFTRDVMDPKVGARHLPQSEWFNEWRNRPENRLEPMVEKARKETPVMGDVPAKREDLEEGVQYILRPQEAIKLFAGQKKSNGEPLTAEEIKKQFGNKKHLRVVIRNGQPAAVQ